MNLPNQLTLGRFYLTMVFVAVLSSTWRYSATAALVIFVLAGITDYADGAIARKYKLESDFGRLMDPLVDKIMLAAGFICLVEDKALPAWVAVVIISREFLITGLRVLAATKGVVLGADKAGKHKTAWQIITVIYFLVLLAVGEIAPGFVAEHRTWHDLAWHGLGRVLLAAALVLTLWSGLGYLWRNRGLISER